MDADKIKNFFIFHVEKIILVAVLGVAAFLAYSGFKKEPITKKFNPERVIADANQVKTSVDDIRTDVIVGPRKPTFDIDREIKKVNKRVLTDGYDVTVWDPGTREDTTSGIKRSDPELLAALHVRAVGVSAPMAVLASGETYPLTNLEPADPVEFEKQPEKKPSIRRRRGGGGSGTRGMEDEMEMEMEMEMGMGMGMMDKEMGMSKPTRKMDIDGVEGFRPPVKVSDNGVDRYSVPYKGSFIAGTAVVPYKLLHDNFASAFEKAEGFNPLRDRPLFLGYELQRADITEKSIDELADEDWVDRYGSSIIPILAAKIWAGFNRELVSEEYREDGTLTMWIPPVMMTDYSTFSLHPMIPMKTASQIMREKQAVIREMQIKKEEDALNDLQKFRVNQGGGNGGTASMGMDDMEMSMGMGGGRGRGRGGRMGGSNGGMLDQDPVEYKLIRFYDFQNPPRGLRDQSPPQQNRKYVYRVRYLLNDPNFPENPLMQPEVKTLESRRTYARVSALAALASKTKVRSFQLKTPWSEPCDPVSLVSSNKVFAGSVVEPAVTKSVTFGNRTITYEDSSPKVEMVVQQFNELYATDISMLIKNVGEGTVLSARAESADIVDPITLEVKKALDAEVNTTTTVIDIDGGQELTIADHEDSILLAPATILLLDENGGLKVHQEVSDQKRFRTKSFATERGK